METLRRPESHIVATKRLFKTYGRIVVGAVDLQNDFGPRGALPAPHGDEVVPAMNRALRFADEYTERGGRAEIKKFASRDRHPPAMAEHFERFGAHCVDGTWGFDWLPGVDLRGATIVNKGTGIHGDALSPWEGLTEDGETLDEFVGDPRTQRIAVVVGGLVTEYCDEAMVMGALERGYDTYLLSDAVRAVDQTPGDGARAIHRMAQKGAHIISTFVFRDALAEMD